MRKRIRRLRQLVPTKFATGHRIECRPCADRPEAYLQPMFTTWWMWLGRSFRVKRTVI